MKLFDSREERYRSPFGALPEGRAVFLRVLLPRSLGCTACRLSFCPDGGQKRLDDMFWAGMEGEDAEWWDCHVTPDSPGLFFYGFELDTREGRRYLSRREDGTALLTDRPGPLWQMTCYRADFQTPDWLAGGVMYQIFPDRFASSGEPKEGVPADRILREDWGGQPEWRPDARGEVRNNDYFQGDLKGIEQRLDRLAELGVTCLYLNPIFEAHSNHRYDTADYLSIDPLLGTQEDLRSLINAAGELGIRVLLDGVFSHTGADSRYFNREGRYPGGHGAYQTLSSPYAGWYRFSDWPGKYAAWWGFKTLPEIDKENPAFKEFINGEKGVVRHWLAAGAAGWRLDVADELPDSFLEELRRAAKKEKPDALVLGEVWEDASNKESYGHRRRYLLGEQLDSVMNYPFRTAILDFLLGGDGAGWMNRVMDIVENYPPQVLRLLMNHIGTHDTPRALTLLGGEPDNGRGREWQAAQKLTPAQRERGLKRMRLAGALQYCLPGVPCIYYGDEAGMEGYKDPFNRGCYPWGEEDRSLLLWYHRLGRMRQVCPALKEGTFHPVEGEKDVVCFERIGEGSRLLCAVNRGEEEKQILLPADWAGRTANLGGGWLEGACLHLPALDCAIFLDNGE